MDGKISSTASKVLRKSFPRAFTRSSAEITEATHFVLKGLQPNREFGLWLKLWEGAKVAGDEKEFRRFFLP